MLGCKQNSRRVSKTIIYTMLWFPPTCLCNYTQWQFGGAALGDNGPPGPAYIRLNLFTKNGQVFFQQPNNNSPPSTFFPNPDCMLHTHLTHYIPTCTAWYNLATTTTHHHHHMTDMLSPEPRELEGVLEADSRGWTDARISIITLYLATILCSVFSHDVGMYM